MMKKEICYGAAIVLVLGLVGCGKETGNTQKTSLAQNNEKVIRPVDPVSSDKQHQENPSNNKKGEAPAYYSPSWENSRSDGPGWTAFVWKIIKNESQSLLQGPRDIERFCPQYRKISQEQRENFWVVFVSEIAKWESDHNPVDRYLEKNQGYDRITRQPVYSEGLLALSYQDTASYPDLCGDISWQQDSGLAPGDIRKTILNPYNNLGCGVRILNHIVAQSDILADPASYWSVVRPQSQYSKLNQIIAETKKIPFCTNGSN